MKLVSSLPAVLRVTIALSRPEEAFQSILSAAGNHVDVKMGDALADAVVDRDECAFCFHCLLDGLCQKLDLLEEPRDQIGREVGQRLVMVAWNEKTVPGEERSLVEKGDSDLVLEN